MAMSLWPHFFVHPVVYRTISYSYCAVSIPVARDKRDAFACRPIATDFRSLQLYLEILRPTSLSLSVRSTLLTARQTSISFHIV